MKASTFSRYVDQFGLPVIERQHRRGFRQFLVLWISIFVVMAIVTYSNWSLGFPSPVWLTLNGLIVMAFFGCAYQRYQLHRHIRRYHKQHPRR
ncbi:hypothetical protein GCM10011369_02300 [Neiella marina]|uniref:Uncharacterized protein n=1 Tax=Neiella marina TaxID=508461 RepID=A0A8J2XMZ9_9GAMM|nr:hypothetical protein [Neiella marina]GGA64482.1 hypothetical protein GCM10011369_02300 [Neiella marina]